MNNLSGEKKYLLIPIFVIIFLAFGAGCSDNNVTGPVNNSVTFRIMNQPGSPGKTKFLFKPNVDVKITEIVSYLQNYDTVVNNFNYNFSKDTFYVIKEYPNVSSGQQWNFQFFGTAVATNAGFIVTTSYTVP